MLQDEHHRAEIISAASAAASCLLVEQGINQSSYLLFPDFDYAVVLCTGAKGRR